MYTLTDEEVGRLMKGLRAILSVPFIDGIEDFIWEAVFAYAKDVTLVDPLAGTRSKFLFDVVETQAGIGWSAKTQQIGVRIPSGRKRFEVVIQRADVFDKREELGFPDLTIDSPVGELGRAVLKHWREKVRKDSREQHVRDKRVCILLKSKDQKKFAYFEEDLAEYADDQLVWRWTNDRKKGLQGRRRTDDSLVYRWYPNQKQLFENFILPEDAPRFEIYPMRSPASEIVELLVQDLERRGKT